ncbi:hypothetical protein [Algoriphagus sediminis]|uniref:Lipoprotein n=1 Tax=Algoriphagus sediminis TaxID=3057113 RepID=A0ABT7YE02_9BACT|nr:hypothetical protein [Algoriphagus sediminis]MDN3204419.1 hypothetical protein [Algoriphagus sediminis]
MIRFLCSITLVLLLFACKSHQNLLEDGSTYTNFRGFIPIDPIEYHDEILLSKDGDLYTKDIKVMDSDEIFQFLNNETVLVSIGQVNAEGGISYLPVTVSTKNSSYKVTMDYMKFATLAEVRQDGSFIGFRRVGVGLRLITLLTTNESGINIGDLSSIGLAAKQGSVKGTMMIEVVGIKSREVTTLLPLPSEINQTTIQNAMQALATIKSKIYDEDTELFPQVMAIKPDSTSRRRAPLPDFSDGISDIPEAQPENPSNEHLPMLGNSEGGVESGHPPRQSETDPMNNYGNDILLQIGGSKSTVSKYQNAKNLEKMAFDYLFQKDIDRVIATLDAAERVYPGFHSVYDINRMLKAERSDLSDPDSPKWKEVYSRILNDYPWKLSDEIIERLEEKIGF